MADSAGRTWTARILTALLALGFLMAGGMKLVDPSAAAEQFAKFGYPAWFVTVIGALEVAGAIGVLVARVAPLAALGLAGLMAGAVFSHLRSDPVTEAVPALVMLAMALGLGWLRKGEMRGAGPPPLDA